MLSGQKTRTNNTAAEDTTDSDKQLSRGQRKRLERRQRLERKQDFAKATPELDSARKVGALSGVGALAHFLPNNDMVSHAYAELVLFTIRITLQA